MAVVACSNQPRQYHTEEVVAHLLGRASLGEEVVQAEAVHCRC